MRTTNLIGRSYLVTVLCVSWNYNRHFLLNLVWKLTRKVSFTFVNLSLKKAKFGRYFLHEGMNLN